MDCHHWIYASTACEIFDKTQLSELLKIARERNFGYNLTGLLLYKNNRFLQVLEGSKDAVDKVRDSIVKDPRHRKIHTLRYEAKKLPDFPDWRMGFSTLDTPELDGYSQFLSPDFDTRVFEDFNSDACRMILSFRNAYDQ